VPTLDHLFENTGMPDISMSPSPLSLGDFAFSPFWLATCFKSGLEDRLELYATLKSSTVRPE
jgi:hypothetical protein